MKFDFIDVADIFYPNDLHWSVMPGLERFRHCNSRAFHGFPGGWFIVYFRNPLPTLWLPAL